VYTAMSIYKKIFCFFLPIIFTVHSFSIASEKEQVLTGSIMGYVIDADTKTPLVGTNIILVGTERGTATNLEGRFFIEKVPVGSYILNFNYIGYEQLEKVDIIRTFILNLV